MTYVYNTMINSLYKKFIIDRIIINNNFQLWDNIEIKKMGKNKIKNNQKAA